MQYDNTTFHTVEHQLIIEFNLRCITYPEGKQWAAVRTQQGAMSVPPQINPFPLKMDASQG